MNHDTRKPISGPVPICAYCQTNRATGRTGSGNWPICGECWERGDDGYQPEDRTQ